MPKDVIEEISDALTDLKAQASAFNESKSKMLEVDARLHDLEQKGARRGGTPAPRTWGEQFVHSDGLKMFGEEHSRPARFRLEVKESTPATITTDAASGGAFGDPTRGRIELMPQRQMTVRDLLPVVQVSTNAIEYVNQTGRTNAAKTVAEGTPKPQSDLEFRLETVPTTVIAHWIAASRQVIEDSPQLRDLIDQELRYGLMLAEEAQLLNGDGTSANLDGLVPNAVAYVDPLSVTSPTMLDTIGTAILQAALAEFPPDGIVLHPADWMRIRLLKDGDGKYILGDPQASVAPNLFGVPVVATQAMEAGKFLIGNFQSAATLYDRWQPRVEVSTEHDDFFVKNLVAILAEERLALAIRQPAALVYGGFAE